MLDFLKILITDENQISSIYNHELLNEYSLTNKSRINKNTGLSEVYQAKECKYYKDVFFCFYPNKLEILFKPHYYYNDTLHNANDFKVLDCIKTLRDFAQMFSLSTDEIRIINIEFGVNALSPIDCKNLITYAEYHDKNQFRTTNDNLIYSKISLKYNKQGKGNTYKMIKFYAKGIQFAEYANINTFRFEVKSKRTKYIKSLGVFTYADLLRPETYKILANNILLEFDKVLILDVDVNKDCLSVKDNKRLTEYLNPIKWFKALQGHRNTFNNHKKNYIKLLDKTGNNIHVELREIISDKLDYLLKGCADLTPLTITEDCAILSSSIIRNCTTSSIQQPIKQCKLTGVDISMQKKESCYLSHTGLWHLYNNDFKQFDEVKRRYLSSKWIGFDIDIQVKEIAHNIRTRINDKAKRERSNYIKNRNQFNLFTNRVNNIISTHYGI